MNAVADVDTAMQIISNLHSPIVVAAVPLATAVRRHGRVVALKPERRALRAAVRWHHRGPSYGRGLRLAICDSRDEREEREGLGMYVSHQLMCVDSYVPRRCECSNLHVVCCLIPLDVTYNAPPETVDRGLSRYALNNDVWFMKYSS